MIHKPKPRNLAFHNSTVLPHKCIKPNAVSRKFGGERPSIAKLLSWNVRGDIQFFHHLYIEIWEMSVFKPKIRRGAISAGRTATA